MYVNNKKINFCIEYNFKKIGKYLIKINCKRKLIHTKNIFSYCSSLTSLNLSNFNTNNVNNMSYMFYDCSSLTSLNLSNFNTNNVKDMSEIFPNIKKNKCELICYYDNLKKEFNKMK